MKEGSIVKKIYYHDTDCGAVVYYANYLKYLEEGRTEFFADAGISMRELTEQGYAFVVARVDIQYKKPAHYQDVIEVKTSLESMSASSISFRQAVLKENTPIVLANVLLVCVNRSFRPILIPESVRKAIEPFGA